MFLNNTNLPFCRGCGHGLIANNTMKALESMGLHPLDVIFVTDIGCHGIIDKNLNTHTVHGLHGRSPALASGISIGKQNPDKKVIVFMGDGGTTIGLQHILEAARLNLDMTIVIHNNYLYGMTGGQTSGLTPEGFRTTTSKDGNVFNSYDICRLSHAAGASYVSRISGVGDISEDLRKAFDHQGFSLVEVLEICPGYGMKFNPGVKLNDIIEKSGKLPGEWTQDRQDYVAAQGEKTNDLLTDAPHIETHFQNNLEKPLSIIMSGSAGEGIQFAASFLAQAAMLSGLHITQKGSYPVTVGVGFSTVELNLDHEYIRFHGSKTPDVALITSLNGLNHNRTKIAKMDESGMLFLDSCLEVPETNAQIITRDFRKVNAKSAALYAAYYFVRHTGIISVESLDKSIEISGKQDKIPLKKIKDLMGE